MVRAVPKLFEDLRKAHERKNGEWLAAMAQDFLHAAGGPRRALTLLKTAIKIDAKLRQKPPGKPQKPILFELLLAAEIQRRDGGGKQKALLAAMEIMRANRAGHLPPPPAGTPAGQAGKKPIAESAAEARKRKIRELRPLLDKVRGITLAEFAERCAVKMRAMSWDEFHAEKPQPRPWFRYGNSE
jgi:hypothetical protein